MQTSFKKILFIVSGLAIISIGFFFGKLNIVQASLKEGQKFEDWGVGCFKDKNKKQVCFLVQQFKITKEGKTGIFAESQIHYLPSKKKLIMIQLLPLGIMLQPGTAIISNGKTITLAKFNICNAAVGCQALAELSNEDVETILATETNTIGVIYDDDKQLNIPLSNKGLKEGLAALKK